jgi:hypothetical protein
LKFALATAALLGAMIAPASAKVVMTPEISALDGTAALAVVAAVVLLVWERRRAV